MREEVDRQTGATHLFFAIGFLVRDNNGQALAYVYFEQEPGRRAAANLLTRALINWPASNVSTTSPLCGAGSLHSERRSRVPSWQVIVISHIAIAEPSVDRFGFGRREVARFGHQ
jgi:hypothetical protein